MAGYVHQMGHPVVGLAPRDITGLAQTGVWISLKNYRRVRILIIQGAWAGGTPAVTLTQALTVTGGTPKPLSFTKRFQMAASGVGGGFAESAVVSDTFNLPNTANQVHVLEVDAATLDSDNGYDCLRVNVGSPGAFADFLTIIYDCAGARYTGAEMPSPLTN